MLPENVPEWLSGWRHGEPVSMSSFMASRVVFYPGCGTDGHPVSFFGKRNSAHCFIYVDYGVSRSHLDHELSDSGHPFLGYSRIGRVEIREHDLVPRGWVPHPPTGGRRVDHPKLEKPFAFLEILERQKNYAETHGADRLAIVFLFADGIATYDALFCQNKENPPYAVVLADHGFGGGWTEFGRGGHLEQLARMAGRYPEYLLTATNTTVWDGFDFHEEAGGGGMHNSRRNLFARA